ncbi:MAG: hypothetical protein AAGH40_05625 [Verrucomicrobiota bacterium]
MTGTKQTGWFKQTGGKFPPVFWVILFLGILVHLVGFLIFRLVSNPLPSRVDRDPLVQFVSTDTLTGYAQFEERAALFDSAPLFLPTRWNAARSLSFPRAGYVPPGFAQFEPDIQLLEDLNVSALAALERAVIETPMDLLNSRYWRFFEQFGEVPDPDFSFADAQPFAEVEVVAGDAIAASSALGRFPVQLELPTAVLPPEPAHLLVRLIGGGYLAGPPVLERSSGSSDFDLAAERWLGVSNLMGSLAEGYYRIKIFPN